MILAGITGTHDMGEITPALDLVARLGRGPLEVECWWTPADKIESPGWAAGGHMDWSPKGIVTGIGYSHRHTEAWDKNAIWVRSGIQGRDIKVVLSQDVTTPNKVTKLDARVTGRVGRVIVEPHGFVALYKQSGQRKVGYGVGVRVGL